MNNDLKNIKNIDIIQWNITSYRAQFEELKILIRDNYAPACICLQETRFVNDRIKPPSQYKILQPTKNRNDDHERGVALLINKKTHHKEISLDTPKTIEAVAAKIWLGKFYTICSIYISPNLVVTEQEILQIIRQLPTPYLILGDMNARHPLWGEPVANAKGNILENILINQDLSLINYHDKTHLSIQHSTKTLIDLSIASSDCQSDFTHLVSESRHGSDHYPIKLSRTTAPKLGEPSLKFKIEKADWSKFTKLTSKYKETPANTSIEISVDHITSFLIEAAKESIPMSGGRQKKKIPIPWWNRECETASRERKRAERALERRDTLRNKIAYKRCKANCRYIFKKARKLHWENYVSSINVNTPLGAVWKK